MANRDHRYRVSSARWPPEFSNEETFDDLDQELGYNLAPLGDRGGRIVSFKAGTAASGTTSSDTGNEANTLTIGLRHVSSPAGSFGERDWSRPTRNKRHLEREVEERRAADRHFHNFLPHHHKGEGDLVERGGEDRNEKDHGHTRSKTKRPSRRSGGDQRPVLVRKRSPRRGVSMPTLREHTHARYPSKGDEKMRSRYPSSGTQTSPMPAIVPKQSDDGLKKLEGAAKTPELSKDAPREPVKQPGQAGLGQPKDPVITPIPLPSHGTAPGGDSARVRQTSSDARISSVGGPTGPVNSLEEVSSQHQTMDHNIEGTVGKTPAIGESKVLPPPSPAGNKTEQPAHDGNTGTSAPQVSGNTPVPTVTAGSLLPTQTTQAVVRNPVEAVPPATTPDSSTIPTGDKKVPTSSTSEVLSMLSIIGKDRTGQDSETKAKQLKIPSDRLFHTKPNTPTHDFLSQTGPLLFASPINVNSTQDQTLDIATSDRIREDLWFSFVWAKSLDGNKILGPPYLRSMGCTVKVQVDKTFEITSLAIKIAKDDKSPPLVFSTTSKALSDQFENASGPTSTSSTNTNVAPITEKSGMNRYPGLLLFGLDRTSSTTSADGGFKTLEDLSLLASFEPSIWLKDLLKRTTITILGSTNATSKTTNPRNAVWYQPGWGSNTSIRLEAQLGLDSAIVEPLNKYISGWKDENLVISAIARRQVLPRNGPWGTGRAGGSLTLAIEPKLVAGVANGLGVYVTFDTKDEAGQNEIDLVLVCYSSKLQWSFLKKWLVDTCTEVSDAVSKLEQTLLGVKDTSSTSASASSGGSSTSSGDGEKLDHIMWRKVSVKLGWDEAKKSLSLNRITLDLEANFQTLVPDGKHAVFAMEFYWDKKSGEFAGECAFNGTGPFLGSGEPPLQYAPGYERWKTLSYLVPSEQYMSLRHISATLSEHLPFGVPTEITYADLFLSNKKMELHGSLAAILGKPAVTEQTGGQSLQINSATLDFFLGINFSSTPKQLEIHLSGTVGFAPYKIGSPTPFMDASISYESANEVFNLRAGAHNIPMTVLHSLFPEGEEKVVAMSILEHITLLDVEFLFQHSKDSGNQFGFISAIDIAGVTLNTSYYRDNSNMWVFDASLERAAGGQVSQSITVGDAISKLLGSGVVDLMPDFVMDTKLTLTDLEKDRFEVICTKIDVLEGGGSIMVFGAELKIGYLHVHFAQISSKFDPKATKTGTGKSSPSSSVKKLIRVSLGPLPSVPELPVVGKLDVPFDSLEFLWVSEAISKKELETLNNSVDMFRQQNIGLGGSDEELVKGFHFRLASAAGGVFLDHALGDDVKKETSKDGGAAATAPKVKEAASTTASASPTASVSSKGSSAASTTAALDKKKGPLTLSGIALSYESGKLRIHLDASVLIGPIAAGVEGLNLIMDLSKVHGLHELLHAPVEVEIEGFDLSFKRDPVMLAGALQHKPGTKAYLGGITISLSNFSIAALGMYDQIDATKDTPAYDSFFVYAMMEGLIFSVGWAEIRGLIAGFGYNSRLRLPTVNELPVFPLIQGLSTPGGFSMNTAMKQLTGPGSFMTPSRGSIWMALGLVVRACEAIDLRAVATLALGPNQTEIGLIARATASLPRGSSPESALVLIDLSVIGKLDLVHGELSIDGLINPTSFILNKNCRPHGSFAVRSWYGKGNAHEGDWVVSFGGYHPQFNVPSHYPVPQRLGISWHFSDQLSITGDAYAAVTPNAIMAGGLLQAVFSAGPFGAHFDAHADFLVNLKPLHYVADIAVFAGVYYELRVWFIRKKFSVDIGASLHLEGPPIYGQVHFDMSVFSFTVKFGDGKSPGVHPISLPELLDLVLQDGTKNKVGDKIMGAHNFSVLSGLVGDSNKKPDTAVKNTDPAVKELWVVRADNFLFQVRSAVPSSYVNLNDGKGGMHSCSGTQDITGRPMHDTTGKIRSTMEVKLCHKGVPGSAVAVQMGSKIEDKLPANYWGKWSSNPADYLRADSANVSINHLVGLTVRPPKPDRSSNYSAVVKPNARPSKAGQWSPKLLDKKTTRYVDDDKCRDSVKWSRVKGAMSSEPRSKKAKLMRECILDNYLKLAHPPAVATTGNGSTATPVEDAETVRVRNAYRTIGARVPSVVLNEPERFYISPPTVFCN